MDHIRNAHLYDASRLEGSTAIVGCGATGSAVALLLAKLGVSHLHLYDDDCVEAHNIPNQVLYDPADVGREKALVLATKINQLTGHNPDTGAHSRRMRVTAASGKLRHERVLLCVDSMAARRAIVEHTVRYNGRTELLLDLRMGAYGGQVLACDPRQVGEYDEYMAEMYGDSDVLPRHVAACGTRPTLVHTAAALAAIAVQLFTVRTSTTRRPAEVLYDAEHWILSTRDSAALI